MLKLENTACGVISLQSISLSLSVSDYLSKCDFIQSCRTHTTTVTQRKGKRRASKSMPEVKLFSDSSDAKVSLLKVKSFNSEPKPNPKAAIFHYPTAYKCLTHYQVSEYVHRVVVEKIW